MLAVPAGTTQTPTVAAVETETQEPTPVMPEETETAKIQYGGKTSSSANKGNTGTGGKGGSTTVTKPAETRPVSTEPKPAETEAESTVHWPTEPLTTEPEETVPPETEPPTYDISGYVVGSLEYEILDRINECRAGEDLDPLYLDSYLCAIASYRGFEASLVWSHTRPDGRSFVTVLDDYGYGADSAQELLAYATGDAAAMVDKWMSSESHRGILLGGHTTLGVGVYRANGYTFVACLLIG